MVAGSAAGEPLGVGAPVVVTGAREGAIVVGDSETVGSEELLEGTGVIVAVSAGGVFTINCPVLPLISTA